MNLHHLRTFIEVWRTGSISRASNNLSITQPAASSHIRALETELGHVLFRRHARGVDPTVVANELANAIGGRLDGAEAAFEKLRLRSDEMGGVVHMAGPSEFMGAKMPAVAAALTAQGIQLHVRFGGRDAIYRWFEEEAIELAITASEPEDRALGFEPVFEEQLLVVAAPSLDLSTVSQANWPWLAYDETLPMVRTYLAGVQAAMPTHPTLIAGSLTFLRDAAMAVAGVAILPDYLCKTDLEEGRLVLVEQAGQLPANRIFLVWRKAALRLPRVVLARDRCLQELAGRVR